MKKMNKYVYAIISGYTVDRQNQIITIFFEPVGYQGILLTQSLTFANTVETYELFRTCPVFTKDGKLDLDCFEGTRVFLKIACMKGGLKIENVEYDVMYYDSNQEEELSGFYEEVEGGGEHGKI